MHLVESDVGLTLKACDSRMEVNIVRGYLRVFAAHYDERHLYRGIAMLINHCFLELKSSQVDLGSDFALSQYRCHDFIALVMVRHQPRAHQYRETLHQHTEYIALFGRLCKGGLPNGTYGTESVLFCRWEGMTKKSHSPVSCRKRNRAPRIGASATGRASFQLQQSSTRLQEKPRPPRSKLSPLPFGRRVQIASTKSCQMDNTSRSDTIMPVSTIQRQCGWPFQRVSCRQ